MSYLDNLKVKTSGVYKSPSSNYTKLNNEFIKLSSSGKEFIILPTPGIDLEYQVNRQVPENDSKNFKNSYKSFTKVTSNGYNVIGNYQSGSNSIFWVKDSQVNPAVLNSTISATTFENCIFLCDSTNVFYFIRYHSSAKHLFKNCLIFGNFDDTRGPAGQKNYTGNYFNNYKEVFSEGTISDFHHLNLQIATSYGIPTITYENCLIKSSTSDEANFIREILKNIEAGTYKPSQVLPGLLNKYLPNSIS